MGGGGRRKRGIPHLNATRGRRDPLVPRCVLFCTVGMYVARGGSLAPGFCRGQEEGSTSPGVPSRSRSWGPWFLAGASSSRSTRAPGFPDLGWRKIPPLTATGARSDALTGLLQDDSALPAILGPGRSTTARPRSGLAVQVGVGFAGVC